MSLFKGLSTEGHEDRQDRVSGARVLNTNVYELTITAAYALKSSGGALGITLIGKTPNGVEFSTTQYVTNKDGQNYFHPKDKEGNPNLQKRNSLPGFIVVEDLCLVTVGKTLEEMDTEQKTVRIYNFEEKKEVPTAVDMITDLIGTTALFAIWKDLVNVEEKDASGRYQITDKTREQNEVEKVMHFPTKVTVKEAQIAAEAGQEPEPIWHDEWVKKNVEAIAATPDKARDRRKKTDGPGTAGRPGGAASGAPPAAGAAPGGVKKGGLFNKK